MELPLAVNVFFLSSMSGEKQWGRPAEMEPDSCIVFFFNKKKDDTVYLNEKPYCVTPNAN